MGDDHTFRTILLAGFLVLIPIAIYHRVRSQATGERLDRRQEGRFILVTLRPLGLATMGGLIAYMLDPAWMAWAAVPLPAWLRWIGVGLGLIAGSLLVWTFRSLGKNLTDTVVTRKEHTLVTTGPYRWVRHPFYSSLALSVLANSLAAANWFLFVTGSLLFMLLVIRTRREEANLVAGFGDEYRKYMQRTGRFVPRIGGEGGR
jgi:protein-S-isoprenylcysteine O-methyltransferase Ste14